MWERQKQREKRRLHIVIARMKANATALFFKTKKVKFQTEPDVLTEQNSRNRLETITNESRIESSGRGDASRIRFTLVSLAQNLIIT